MGIGTTELLIILAIVVLIFGAAKLPALGAAMGKSISNFKKSVHAEEAETKDANALKDGKSS
jgi:sec-independent protein translocase protein TatA